MWVCDPSPQGHPVKGGIKLVRGGHSEWSLLGPRDAGERHVAEAAGGGTNEASRMLGSTEEPEGARDL